MKISQIITEKYENQDPNRPADGIDNAGNHKWYDTMGRYHRDGDKPAIIAANDTQVWYQHGKRHRDGDKPAYITAGGTKEWWQHNKQHRDGDKPAVIGANGTLSWWHHDKLHRETGPAVEWPSGYIEFWLNNKKYKIDDWAEKVGMHAIDLHDMKEKYGIRDNRFDVFDITREIGK